MKRTWFALPIAILGLLVSAAPGFAATTRYAAVGAPDDYASGPTDCTYASPCSLQSANFATSGDVVMLKAGTYPLSSVVTINSGVTMEPAPGESATLNFANPYFLSLNLGATVRGFTVTGNNTAYLVNQSSGSGTTVIDHMRITNSNGSATGAALTLSDSVSITDSVITATGSGTVNAVNALGGDIRNSTIIANSSSVGTGNTKAIARSCSGPDNTHHNLQVHNTILHASGGLSTLGYYSNENTTGLCFLDGALDYSYFGALSIAAAATPGHAAVVPGVHNIPTLPTLDSTAKQTVGSSSIDKGTVAYASIADTDIFGEPRIFGLAPDIGADEYYVAPANGGGGGGGGGAAPDTIAPTISLLKAVKQKGKLKSFDFTSTEAGTATFKFTRAYKKKHKTKYKSAGTLTKPVVAGKNSIKPKKLKKGSYKLSLTVKDASGNVSATKKLSFKVK